MKKLLTMMVSCASALFAMADVTLPTEKVTFDGYNATPGGAAIPLDTTKDDNKDTTGISYWYSTATESEAVVTNNGNAYLMLDTSSVLQRTIGGYTTTDDGVTFASKSLSGGAVYFDSMVQFTATEDDVTPSEGDKLVVWLQAVEAADAVMDGETVVKPPVSASTNLMITAGVPGEGTSIKPVSYKVTNPNISVKPNEWARLTIKSFLKEDTTVPYFSVFVNGVAVDTEVGNEFLSLVDSETLGHDTITSVGFKGTGAVDDLLFTNADPLVQTFPLSVVVPNGCAVISCLVGGDAIESTAEETYLVDVTATDVKVMVEVPSAFNVTNANAVPGEIVDGMQTWTVPVSITSATANTPFSFTVTVEAKEVPAAKPFSITIGETTTTYETLKAAFDDAPAGATIVVAKDANGDAASYNVPAFKIEKSIIIDLNGNTLVLEDPGVGANDSIKSLGIRIGSEYTEQINVTIMDGTIAVDNTDATNPIKMMIQNYANLTLTDVELDGTNLAEPANNQPKYVLSNNRGTVLLNRSTSIIVPAAGAKGSVAFDVCEFVKGDVPTVTLSTTGTIGGDVEVTGGNFVYTAGTISGAIKFSSGTISVAEAIKNQIEVPTGKELKVENDVWILVDETEEPEPTAFTITVTFGTGITGASYKIGDADAVALADGDASDEIAKDTVVTITAVAADWYKAPEAQTITLTEDKRIELVATAVTSENIGDLAAEIPAEAAGDVLNWAKNSGMTTDQVLAAPYLYEDYLFNFTQPSQAKPTIEITSITLVDGVATVEAKVTVDGVTKIETLTSATGLNGAVMYKAAATLDALKTATPKDAIAEGDQFIQIVVE